MAGIHNAIIGTAQTFGYSIEIIIVGGGGGGGYGAYNGGLGYYTIGGGGSAGGVSSQSVTVKSGDAGYTFTIGSGGVGGDPGTFTPASSGTSTSISGAITTDVGFGGAGADVFDAPTFGGGGLGGDASLSSNTGAFNIYTGYSGGDGDVGISFGWPGGGGGGAGAAGNGSAGSTASGGDGGPPPLLQLWYDIYTPFQVGRGGGGGAGGDDTVNPGPTAGGNFGYANQGGWWDVTSGVYSTNGGNATQYGDGGGGGTSYPGFNTGLGGNGYQGVAIVRYLGPQQGTGGDAIWTAYGYTYHLFHTSGTFNP